MLSQPEYELGFYKPEGIVALTWLPGTEQMDDEDFKAALEVFAEAALQHRPSRLIIDMREFRGRPSEKVLAFRDDVTVPKYERAGIKKLAWVWPGVDASNTGTGAAYDQRCFESRDEAIAWPRRAANRHSLRTPGSSTLHAPRACAAAFAPAATGNPHRTLNFPVRLQRLSAT